MSAFGSAPHASWVVRSRTRSGTSTVAVPPATVTLSEGLTIEEATTSSANVMTTLSGRCQRPGGNPPVGKTRPSSA